MSTTWLKLLPLRLSEIEEFREPPGEVDPSKDHLVGEMSEDLKKLYSLWQDVTRSLMQQCIEAKFANTEPEGREAFCKVVELRAKESALESLFWISVRDAFALWDKNLIAVKAGFIVVWKEEKEQPKNIFDFPRGFEG